MLRDRVTYLVQGLSVRYGRAFAKEGTKRDMLAQKENGGRRPGEKSIGRVERQLAKEGRMKRLRLYPGGIDATGRRHRLPGRYDCSKGLVIVELLSRQVVRANERARLKAARQQRKPARPPRPSQRPHTPPPAGRPYAPALGHVVDEQLCEANAAAAGELLRMLGPPTREK